MGTVYGLIFLLALLLAPALVLARAGGGEGFGGGGFGGGGGGGGGGGVLVFELLYFLVILHPAVGIPVVLVAGVFYLLTHRSVAGYVRDQRTQRGLDAMDDNREAAALAALKQRDPAFNLDRFYARVQTAFLKIQNAWCAQNLQTVRPFISDGIHERFNLQFLEQKDEGVRDRMADIRVESVRLAQLTSDNVFDTAVVCVQASAVDQQVSLSDGRVVSGSSQPAGFTEYWSFLRRRGAASIDKDGLIEGHCPNCGAPVALNAAAQCQSCHALLRDGQYDWVLVEITQESEWRPESGQTLPGVSELQRRDPDFTVADLEDRASVMFWRTVRADRLGKVDPLRKVATPGFVQIYQKLLAGTAPGPRAFWGDCAVGGLETLGVICAASAGEAGGRPVAAGAQSTPGAGAAEAPAPRSGGTAPNTPGHDRALLSIRWSARRYQVDTHGRLERTAEANVEHHLLVLMRQANVKTDVAAGVSSAHCPACGAPVVDDVSDACSYCGAVFNDGSRGWVLAEMLPASSGQAQQLLAELAGGDAGVGALTGSQIAAAPGAFAAAPPEPSGLLAWMVQAVVANRGLDTAQEQMLRTVAQRQKISDEQLHRLLDAARRGQLHTPQPRSPAEVQQWLGAMIAAALANGDLTTAEQRLMMGVGFQYGLSVYDVKMLVKRQKDQLYTNAVSALRQRRTLAAAA